MFDLDIGKLLVVGVVALVVVGPKDLPRVLRAAGQIMAKVKGFRDDMGKAVTRFAAEADLDSIDKEFAGVASAARANFTLDPAMTMRGRTPSTSVGDAAPRDHDDSATRYASPEMAAYLEPSPTPMPLAHADELKDEASVLEESRIA